MESLGQLRSREPDADGPASSVESGPQNATAPTPKGVAAAALAASAVSACGGGGGSDPPALAPLPPPSFTLDAADMAAARLVLHAQIAATDEDIAGVRAQGAEGWLDAQLAMPVGEKAYDWLMSTGRGDFSEEYRFYVGTPYVIEHAMAHQLVVPADRVRKRMALALSEYFVVSNLSIMQRWSHFFVAAYWDVLNEHAFGNLRQLLEAITLNPAMGLYLNTLGNEKEDAATGRMPDENYAREVMQLFTLGLFELNLDGTPKRDTNGSTIPTYAQEDVSQLARVFTGYVHWDDGQRFTNAAGRQIVYPEFARRTMQFQASRHSMLAVRFLDSTIPANTPGPRALAMALDTLFEHPNVGPFFARQMIQRLVTSHPSPAYVARVAAKFNDNGFGVRGDLKAVWKAILLDDEATSADGLTSPTFGKVREPMVRIYQWARTFKLTSARGTWKWSQDSNPERAYGQRPLHSPSVFNFFRPGYVAPGTEMAASQATAPEFQILNESTVSQWINLIESYAVNGLFAAYPDRPGFPVNATGPTPTENDMRPDYSAEIMLLDDPSAVIRRLNLLLSAGQLSMETQQKIYDILNVSRVNPAVMTQQQKHNRVAAAITLVMCCVEYLVQK